MTGRLPRLTRMFTLGALLGLGDGCAHTHATPPPPSAVPPTKVDPEHAAETGISIASTPQGLMQDGAEEKIQRGLKAKGFLHAEHLSGQLDPDTREALRRYQKSEGLPPTGLPSYETVRHLGLSLDAVFHTTPHPNDPTARPSGRHPSD
jgi:hypothetical protein